MSGQRVCRMHGGSAPQSRQAAERRGQEAQAEDLLRRLLWNPDAAPVTNSVGEMQRLAGSMRQAADVLGQRLNSGEACEECGRGPEPLDGVTGTAWVRVLRELRQLLADMERLGISRHDVELQQGQAQIVVTAVLRMFEVLQLVPADRDLALRTFLQGLGRGPETADVVAGEVSA